jgi:hypothetical protein
MQTGSAATYAKLKMYINIAQATYTTRNYTSATPTPYIKYFKNFQQTSRVYLRYGTTGTNSASLTQNFVTSAIATDTPAVKPFPWAFGKLRDEMFTTVVIKGVTFTWSRGLDW